MDKKAIKNLTPKELKAIKEFQKDISQRFKVVDLKLFGSKARGDHRKGSDIDILLVLEKPTIPIEYKVYDLVNNILMKRGVDLSVKIFSEKEYKRFNRIPTVFMSFIQKEAISLL